MDQTIRKKLDHITDILWGGGVTNPVTYIDQISYLIYLKLLDEEENSRELQRRLKAGDGRKLFPGQAERFRWSKWKFKSGAALRDFVRDDVFPYMASLVKDEPQVAEYFRDAVLEVHDPNVLKQVVDELDGIDFRKLGPDVKGDIFEYLLTHLGQSALNGQFRTPRQIRTFMVEMVDPDLGDTVYDPACGTAGFLVDVVDYLRAEYSKSPQEIPIYGEDWLEKRGQTVEEARQQIPNLQVYRKGIGERIPKWDLLEASIYGTDVSRQMLRISMMNLVLHGIRKARLKRANVLSEMGGLTDDDLHRKYQVILSNPPFAGVLPQDSIRQDLPTSSKKSELLFLSLMLESLAPGGRCAVVVPEGALFGSTGAHVELREKLLRENEILAVVSLPAGVFKPYSGVKTSVLVFRRPKDLPKKGKPATQRVWFCEIKNDGYDPDKVQGGGRPETPELNDISGLLRAWAEYKRSRFKDAPGVEAGKALPPTAEEPRSWWAGFEMIQGCDFNLTAGRYKPPIAENLKAEDPEKLIGEVLGIERRIAESLEAAAPVHRVSAELRALAPPVPARLTFAPEEVVWHLTLDQIEVRTGRILSQTFAAAYEAGSSTFPFDQGNVLYSKLRPYLAKVVRPLEHGIATTELVPLRPRRALLEPNFLAYYLRSSDFTAFATQYSGGAKMPRVMMAKFWSHEVPLPPLSEQRQILKILDQADGLRQLRCEADSKAEKALRAVFARLFGSGHAGLPAEPLGDLLRQRSGALQSGPFGTHLHNSDFVEGGTALVVGIDNVQDGGFELGRNRRIAEEKYSELRKYTLEPGDVLITIMGSIGRTCVFPDWAGPAICSKHVYRIQVDREKLHPDYLCDALRFSPEVRAQLGASTTGQMVAGIASKSLKDLRIKLPALSLQQEYAVAKRALVDIAGQRERAKKLIESIFDQLVRRAFTGELTAAWREAHMKELLQEMELQAKELASLGGGR